MLLVVFRRFLVIAAAFSLVLNLVLLAPSLFMLQVYDRVLVSRSLDTLWLLTGITAGWLLLGAAIDILRQRVLAHAAAHLDQRFGTALLTALLDRAATPGRSLETGALRDLGTVRGFLAGPAVLAVFDAPWIPIYLLVISLFHPLLGVIAAGAGALLVTLTLVAGRLSAPAAARAGVAGARAGSFVQASLRAADAVSAHGMAPGIAQAWSIEHGKALADGRDASRITAGFAGVTRGLRQGLQVAMLAAGAWLVIDLHVSSGVTIAATILLGRMLAPLESMAAHWRSLGDVRAAWQRLAADAVLVDAGSQRFSLPTPAGRLELQDVCFQAAADAPPTLRHVSCVVEPGEVLAVVGASGSGKSTLARLMIGVWKPASGQVRLDGVDLAGWSRAALGPHLGYCPQDVQLLRGTVAQNIARFGPVDAEAVAQAARRARCDDMIARLPKHYDSEVGEGGSLLSGGQRQRVALARALYGNPRLIVLDEPNASLDSEGERSLDLVLQSLREDGVAVVVITQRSQVVEQADKVLVMHAGAVERFGRRRVDAAATVQPLHAAAQA